MGGPTLNLDSAAVTSSIHEISFVEPHDSRICGFGDRDCIIHTVASIGKGKSSGMRRMLFVYGIFKSFIGGSLWDLDIFLELSTKMAVAAETERPMVLRKKCCCMIVYAECQMVLNKVFTRLTHGYQMGETNTQVPGPFCSTEQQQG